MKYKITIIGHFGFGFHYHDGQTVKTTGLYNELIKRFGEDRVKPVDTHHSIRSLILSPFQTFSALLHSECVMILPADRSLKVYAPLLRLYRGLFRKRKLFYVVIGGWLAQYTQKSRFMAGTLRRFDRIFVEAGTMKTQLEQQDFDNVSILRNFKELHILQEAERQSTQPPYRLCTFSRVTPKKGIEDAIEAVALVNRDRQSPLYELDIYGQVFPEDREWFDRLAKDLPPFVHYMGVAEADRSVDILKGYDCLLFPTHYYTEGVPGTIIDAYAAGLPVISSAWLNFGDVVDDGITGIGYDFNDPSALARILASAARTPGMLSRMKPACLRKAELFTPQSALAPLWEVMDRE